MLNSNQNNKHRLAVVGANGYTGSELCQWLWGHPNFEITTMVRKNQSSETMDELCPNFKQFYNQPLLSFDEAILKSSEIDAWLFALPNYNAMDLVNDIPKNTPIIDLSGDFRLNPDIYSKYYNKEHTSPEIIKEFQYLVPDLPDLNNQDNLSSTKISNRISNPGCFAISIILALAPLVAYDLLEPNIICDAKTGSSGSGAGLGKTTHHPERGQNFFAYKTFAHQHVGEIEQQLNKLQPSFGADIWLQTHATPMIRGIYSSCYGSLKKDISSDELNALYIDYYQNSNFIRILSEKLPQTLWVQGSNFCDIAIRKKGKKVAVFATIDNLIKGAAGSAIQSLNRLFGLPDHINLNRPPSRL